MGTPASPLKAWVSTTLRAGKENHGRHSPRGMANDVLPGGDMGGDILPGEESLVMEGAMMGGYEEAQGDYGGVGMDEYAVGQDYMARGTIASPEIEGVLEKKEKGWF